MSKHIKKTGAIKITPNRGWAEDFWNALIPLQAKIVEHRVFQKLQDATLPVPIFRRALISFYPLVHHFRDHMRLNVIKARASHKDEQAAKDWLNDNIDVEQDHARWWILWGMSFGCRRHDFENVRPIPEIDALNHYLWDINTRSSLVEGIAATNLAIEWPTGTWAKWISSGIEKYAKRGLCKNVMKGSKWVNAHALYDDNHPFEAFELIKLCAQTAEDRRKAFLAAQRSMEYYLLALNHID